MRLIYESLSGINGLGDLNVSYEYKKDLYSYIVEKYKYWTDVVKVNKNLYKINISCCKQFIYVSTSREEISRQIKKDKIENL